ncbi:transporter substrate-binding domain-containing protein [Pelovirga terrestris]|uniref:histidine kinase n=1 Tax=Pelovirga terrestris TaxID=2771352 RepID=A0A8J6URS4_9BACT|nr:transporter substrate-binding domain-containing protein [Pelovirga terrestris]MBD1401836.1 transporter substrate-binding domain-containing protein [Pelovirga terrestris]
MTPLSLYLGAKVRGLRSLSIVAALLLQLFFAVTLMANDPITSAAEIDYPPFSIVTDDGRVDGFSVELLRAALKAMGRDVTFRTGTWTEVRALLENGKIQALPLVGRTPEREALFDFTFPYMSLHGAIVVRTDTDGIRTLDDLRGRRVAVMKGDNAEEFLRRTDRGIHIFTTATFEQALQALHAGSYDAVVMQRLVALRLLQETGLSTLRVIDRPIEGFRQDFSFAVKDGDRATLALLNEGLSLIIADGTYQRLHAKWFAALQLPARQRLIVGGDINFPPYEYLDTRGNPSGFLTELTRAIAFETHLDIEIRLGPWDQVVKQLTDGEIDIIQGMFYSPQRSQQFDFGPSHLLTHYVSAVRRGGRPAPESYAELAGLRLVAQRGDVIVEELQNRGLSAQLTLVDSQEEALQQLLDGRHDCALVARLPALALFEKNNWTSIQLGRDSLLERNYAYTVKKGQQALLAKLNEGLQAIHTNGEYRRIHDKWLAHYHQPDTLWVAMRYSAIILSPLVLVLVAILLWSWTLRRQVALQTRQIHEDQLRLQAITDTAQDAILMMNPEGEVAFSNPAVRNIFGYEPEEILGCDLHSFFRFEDLREKNLAAITLTEQEAMGNGSAAAFELTTRHKEGHEISVELSLGQVELKEGTHKVGVIRDISLRKAVEAEVQQKNEELEQFVYLVSHDLKSPLITISSFLEMLQEDIAANNLERVAKDLNFIRGGINKMDQLLSALLRLSRTGQKETAPQRINFHSLIDSTLRALAGPIRDHAIDVVVEPQDLSLFGDPLQLGQIWQNLIENAIKYRGDQPKPRIIVGVDLSTKEPEFFICDNGIGIAPKHSKQIFGLFAQLHPESDGCGLGLALVKKIVERYQGTIRVESAGLGKGSCFYFTLPDSLINQDTTI